MSSASKIEWTDATWTPIRARNLKTGKIGWHCEHATAGCEHCYSEGFNQRLGTGLPFKPGHRKDIEIFLDEEMLLAPLRWKKPRMIFVCSMTDAFADFVKDEWLDRMFAVMALTPQHTYQVLTKRAERMRSYMVELTRQEWWKARLYEDGKRPYPFPDWPLKNVWLGVSTERQKEADERIPHLLQTPAAVRFISAEPLLGPITLNSIEIKVQAGKRTYHDYLDALSGEQTSVATGCVTRDDGPSLDWVIVGGESGPGARPMHPQWARDLRDQCKAAGVPFFFKQHGAWAPICGMTEDQIDACYHPAPEGSEARRREKTESLVLQVDGTRFEGDARFSYGAFQFGTHPMTMFNLGKKAAGRLLDNRTHDDMPGRVG